MLSLVEDGEVAGLGLPELSGRFQAADLACLRLPIADYSVPDDAFETAWPIHRARALGLLAEGGKVLVHCRGGQGRSGTIAAALLIAGGLPAQEAIDLVRADRPAAIETASQEAWLRALCR